MPLDEHLPALESALREQLEAAWQIHVAKVEEQLRSGWREHIAQAVRERRGEIQQFVNAAESSARREASERFNQVSRRLRLAESIDEWRAILLEGAAAHCARAALYDAADPEIAGAPAFATVIETRDTVVTLRSSSELSKQVTDSVGESPSARSHLFPILAGEDVAAILYAEQGQDGLDRNALELLATMASGTMPRRTPPAGLIQLGSPAAAAPVAEVAPPAAEDRELHLRAQRFARVRVAEMRLYDSAAVRHGRSIRDIYSVLRSKIDSSRTEFEREYLKTSPTMTDYLHEEMVRTLANDDVGAMGSEYPGALG